MDVIGTHVLFTKSKPVTMMDQILEEEEITSKK